MYTPVIVGMSVFQIIPVLSRPYMILECICGWIKHLLRNRQKHRQSTLYMFANQKLLMLECINCWGIN